MIPIDLKPISEIETETIKWLWEGRIPLGSLTLLEGRPGVGKTILLSAIAASVTIGQRLPDSDLREPANVLYLSGDEHISRLKIRLLSAHADLNRVFSSNQTFTLNQKGVDWLRAQAAKDRPLLIIIDPIQAYLAGYEGNGLEVRALTDQLKDIATQFNCAIVLVQAVNRLSRDRRRTSSGSIEWTGGMASVLQCGNSLIGSDHPILIQTKNNYAEIANPIGYQIEADEESPSGARFHWIEV